MTNREALCIEVDFSLPASQSQTGAGAGHRVAGQTSAIRCDNGPEYISEELKQWAQQKRIALVYQPGNPQQNAYHRAV